MNSQLSIHQLSVLTQADKARRLNSTRDEFGEARYGSLKAAQLEISQVLGVGRHPDYLDEDVLNFLRDNVDAVYEAVDLP